ncbi:MAG: hypothetical protein ACKO3W_08985 [bacterium]
MTPTDPAAPSVLDFRSTEFLLLALGVVMTVIAFTVGIWLFRAALREHRAQLELERRERVTRAAEASVEKERDA